MSAPREDPTLQQLLGLLSSDKFDKIEQQARLMRETFQCPPFARDYDEFKNVIHKFFAHYQKAFFNVDILKSKYEWADEFWKSHAVDFAQRLLGNMRAAEMKALTGREGGLIGVINQLTEGILRLHAENYVKNVFYDHIPASDFDLRLRLTRELLKTHGQRLFPGEQMLPDFLLMADIESVIKAFVAQLEPIRRSLRGY